MKRYSLYLCGLLALWACYSPPSAQALCSVSSAAPTFNEGSTMQAESCDLNGYQRVTLGGSSGGGLGTATAAAPSLAEGASATFSFTLSGGARVSLADLIFGEDSTNNLLMTSGGAVRITQLVGTGGVPSTASDATTTANILPVGKKTFHSVVTCTGTCVQTQKIYGAFESSATVAKSTLVCILTNNASTTATDWCKSDVPYSYWFVVTSATSGTTPLAGLFVMY